jgi:hypothetical protein
MGESGSTPHLARPCPGLVMIVTMDHSLILPAAFMKEKKSRGTPCQQQGIVIN